MGTNLRWAIQDKAIQNAAYLYMLYLFNAN